MLKRTNINFVNNLLKKNSHWKILDLGCGYTANENATIIADLQDLSSFYNTKNFVQINDKKLPFKDKEFDFVISSHVIEHVKDFQFFISEIERISLKGYIELPTRLGDNLIFENKTDHIWWFVYDDIKNHLIASEKNQLIEPFVTVSMGKKLESAYRESLVIEIMWEEKINYIIDNKIFNYAFIKVNFFTFIRKYFSKKIRTWL